MEHSRESRKRWLKGWLVFEVIALIAAFLSAGGGHGDYLLVRLLFPIPMYIGLMQQSLAGVPTILSLLQYPVVGLVPYAFSWRQSKWVCALFVVIHIIFVFMVFAHRSTQFG